VPPYQLKSQPTTDVAHYISGNPNEPTSEVIVRHMPVISSDPDHAGTEVEVDLSRGDILSPRGQADDSTEVKLLPSIFRRW